MNYIKKIVWWVEGAENKATLYNSTKPPPLIYNSKLMEKNLVRMHQEKEQGFY